jgi:hypothetical protein
VVKKKELEMKVFFKYGYSAFSGKLENLVCQSWFDGRLCLGRRFTYPEITANNTHIGAIGKNLGIVFKGAAAGYITDLKTYCKRNKQEHMPRNVELLHPMPGPLPIFMKMMFAWYDSDPTHVDLSTVTIADIVALDADVRNISRAIGAGFLPTIKVYADLTHNIQ